MSIVIVGGNERMVCQYEDICKGFGCKAKVFAKEKGAMKKKIGAPDLLILFTSTVSHKMVNSAVEEAKRKSIPVCRCHTSSASALEGILRQPEVARRGIPHPCNQPRRRGKGRQAHHDERQAGSQAACAARRHCLRRGSRDGLRPLPRWGRIAWSIEIYPVKSRERRKSR